MASRNDSSIDMDIRRPNAEGFLTMQTLLLCLQVLLGAVWIPATVCGISTNTVNIVVFLKIGLKDPVNVSFLALSISDFAYLLVIGAAHVCNTFSMFSLAAQWVIHPFTLLSYLVWYYAIFYDASILITTYIAVARCCCVTMALKFRHFFTVRKTIIVVIFIVIFVVATHLPMIVGSEFVWIQIGDNSSFVSKLTIREDKLFQTSIIFHDIFNRNILPYTCWAITIVCIAALIFTLKSSSKFRNKMQQGAQSNEKMEAHPEKDKSSSPNDDVGLSKRDVQVVKTVTLVSGIFVFCTSLLAFTSVVRVAIPDFDGGKRYQNLFYLSSAVSSSSGFINAAVNAVVYYNFNSKYRKTFHAVIKLL